MSKVEKYAPGPEVEAGTTAPGRDVYDAQLDVFGDESNAQVSRAPRFLLPLYRRTR